MNRRGDRVLAELAMENGDDFQAGDGGAGDVLRPRGEGGNFRMPGFGEIALGNVGAIEVAHQRSRSSETICVLSVLRGSAVARKRLKPGRRRRSAKGTPAGSETGTRRAMVVPRSVTAIGCRAAA